MTTYDVTDDDPEVLALKARILELTGQGVALDMPGMLKHFGHLNYHGFKKFQRAEKMAMAELNDELRVMEEYRRTADLITEIDAGWQFSVPFIGAVHMAANQLLRKAPDRKALAEARLAYPALSHDQHDLLLRAAKALASTRR